MAHLEFLLGINGVIAAAASHRSSSKKQSRDGSATLGLAAKRKPS
jgi:hypothetical protein